MLDLLLHLLHFILTKVFFVAYFASYFVKALIIFFATFASEPDKRDVEISLLGMKENDESLN